MKRGRRRRRLLFEVVRALPHRRLQSRRSGLIEHVAGRRPTKSSDAQPLAIFAARFYSTHCARAPILTCFTTFDIEFIFKFIVSQHNFIT